MQINPSFFFRKRLRQTLRDRGHFIKIPGQSPRVSPALLASKTRVIEETKGTAITRRNYGGVSALAQTGEAWPSHGGFLPRSTRLFDEIIPSGRVVLRCRKRQQTESRSQTGSALSLVNKNRPLAQGEIKPFLFHFARSKNKSLPILSNKILSLGKRRRGTFFF